MSDEEKNKLEEKVIQLETKRLDEKVEGVDKRLNLKIDERTTQVRIIFGIIGFIILAMGYGGYKFIHARVEKEVAKKTEKVIAEIGAELGKVEELHSKATETQTKLELYYKKVAGLESIPPEDATPEAKKNVDALVKAIKQKPILELTANDYFWLGYQDERKGKYERAVFYYSQALELGFIPLYAIHNNLGNAYYNLKRHEDAAKELKEALRLKSDLLEAHNNLGFVYIGLKRYVEAVKEFKKVLQLNPDFPNAHKGLGDAYDNLNKEEEAVKEYQEALRLKPDFFEAHNNLGAVYFSLKMYDKAIKEYQEALSLKPDSPVTYFNIAHVYAYQGRSDAVISSLEQAIQYGFNDLTLLKTASVFNSIRNTKKFKELIKKVEEQQKKH